VVSAAHLLEVVRDLADDKVEIEADEEKMEISSGGGRMRIPGMPPGEFPEVGKLGTEKPVKVPGDQLAGMLDKVAYAAGQEETRYAINGVFLKISKRDLELVATDARRLALARCKLGRDTKVERGAILPLKLVAVLKKLAAGQEAVDLVLRESEAVFACGPAVLTGRLVEGSYPKYEEAVPADCDRKMSVSREALRVALRQAANFTVEDSRAVTLRVVSGKLAVEARTAERGEASIVLEADCEGPGVELAFNPQYLLDAISHLEGDRAVIEFKNPSRPALIAEGKDDLNVVMPVRLPGQDA
jgi:DNA polymerase-3 subunit beta